MSRDLDISLQAALANNEVQLAVLAVITLKSGTAYVWSGVGDLFYGGNTYKGVGSLGNVSAILEGTDVRADGVTVALSGLGSMVLASAAPPAGLTPPVTVPAGQYVSWSQAGAVALNQIAGAGSVAATLTSALITRTAYAFGDETGIKATWSDFPVPELPADAVIQAIYPVALASFEGPTSGGGIFGDSFGFPSPSTGEFSGQYSGASLGNVTADITGASLEAAIVCSLEQPDFLQTLTITNLGLAIYYTSAQNAYAAINEALGDVQLGAAAKIFFGLITRGTILATPEGLAATPETTGGTLAAGTYFYVVTALDADGETVASSEASAETTGTAGSVELAWDAVPGATSYKIYRGTATGAEDVYYASTTNSFTDTGAASEAGTVPASQILAPTLIGSPYQVFAGQVDQPTVDVDVETTSIALALESRLSNLARPSARRYTAADQHLAYRDDTGFNWVETLNDIALRWGG